MSQQRYVSSELAHFVGQHEPTDDARYELLLRILRCGWLLHGPDFDPNISGNLSINADANFAGGELFNPQVVCFCDIPPDDLTIHTAKYGRFGLAFPKSLLIERGANPVFYVAVDSLRPHDQTERGPYFDNMAREFLALVDLLDQRLLDAPGVVGVPPESHRLHDLDMAISFEVFSYMKPFRARSADDDPANYYMEREWRVVGRVPFDLSEVSRTFLPESYAPRLDQDLPAYQGEVTLL